MFFLSSLFLDIAAPHGLPQRYNPFTEPPYITYLKNQTGYWRVMGDTTALMPNWASAFKIMDVRYINELGTINWYRYYRRYSLDDTLLDWGELSPWFTGRRFIKPDIEDLGMKNDLCPSMSISEFLNLANNDMIGDKVRSLLPLYSLLGVRYILTTESDINFPLVYQGEVNVYENRSALPRVFVAHEVEYVPLFQDAQKRLGKKDFDLRHKVILEEELPLENYIGEEKGDSASIIDYTYNKVTIKAEAKTPGILVLTDVFYPGWKAEIDGKPAKIYRVDGLVRGVYLPQGAHEVVFRYLPRSFAEGVITTLLSFFACLILLIFLKPKIDV